MRQRSINLSDWAGVSDKEIQVCPAYLSVSDKEIKTEA